MDKEKHKGIWLRMLAEREISLQGDSQKILRTQGNAAANAYKKERSIDAVEEAIKTGQSVWQRVLSEHYNVIIKQFSDYTNEELTGKTERSNFASRVQDFINTQGLLKSQYITGTTIKNARQIIINGHKNGDGEKKIAKALKEGIGGPISGYRANTIARTEVHNAATYAMQETAEDIAERTSQQLMRQWVAVDDERTREWHADADGQTVGMDEPFLVDDEEIDRPGEGSPENAINCRCSLIYGTADELGEGD